MTISAYLRSNPGRLSIQISLVIDDADDAILPDNSETENDLRIH